MPHLSRKRLRDLLSVASAEVDVRIHQTLLLVSVGLTRVIYTRTLLSYAV